MHGLFIRAAHCFVNDTIGADAWNKVLARLPEEIGEYAPFAAYDWRRLETIVLQVSSIACQPVPDLLEDIGTYLVAHHNCETTRRLLRFGGATFAEAVFSLSELHDRAKLAVPNLELPKISVEPVGHATFLLDVSDGFRGAVHVLAGLLRALADDYGALVLIDKLSTSGAREALTVSLLDVRYADGRGFDLIGGPVAQW